jgi:hypothetical protein
MARKQRSTLKTLGLPQKGMQLGQSMGAGVIDPTTIPLPESTLKQWFSNVAAVAQFSAPVRPR